MRNDHRNAVARIRNYYWRSVNPNGSYTDLVTWLAERLTELDWAIENEPQTPDHAIDPHPDPHPTIGIPKP